MKRCECEVCEAIGSVDPWAMKIHELADFLRHAPASVQAVLAAQGRVLQGSATEEDSVLVEAAATRCTAGRFPGPKTVH